jgi:hypothetical protein
MHPVRSVLALHQRNLAERGMVENDLWFGTKKVEDIHKRLAALSKNSVISF